MSVIWQQRTHGTPRRREQANRTAARLFLTVVLVITALATAYLALEASNVHISRRLWDMENAMVQMQRDNQALRVEIARLSSIPVLQERSVGLGYQPATSVDYLYVGGP